MLSDTCVGSVSSRESSGEGVWGMVGSGGIQPDDATQRGKATRQIIQHTYSTLASTDERHTLALECLAGSISAGQRST